ncbi:MAG: glutathione S-transferase [Pseudomonadota bacterium]
MPTLFVGDHVYSSWSLRGWLVLDAFEIPFSLHYAHLKTPAFDAMAAEMAPSRLVPALKVDDGTMVWDSLAMAETLAEQHPGTGIWPANPQARATARSLAATMHSGFGALRSDCPMNMRRAYAGFQPSAAVEADLAYLSALWAHARGFADGSGPYLFGAFTAADAFFAPVASRIATYGLPVGPEDGAYVAAVLAHPSVRRWRAMGMAKDEHQAHYEFDLPARPNPHEPAVTGTVIAGAASENSDCPYSGKPVAEDCLVQVQNRVIGYCNPFCAAKTAADPLAWPKTAALLEA